MNCTDADLSRPASWPASSLPRQQCLTGCLPCWQKLEQVAWNTGLTFSSYGTRFGLRATDPAVRERLFGLLPPGAVSSPSSLVQHLYSLHVGSDAASTGRRRFHLLYDGIQQIARTHNLEEALSVLGSHLHNQVAVSAQDRLFVHAGVVGWQGCALVIPGRSFSGKTSLTAALVRAGADYFSDEYAVFDSRGFVHPYPKPLSIRDAAGQPLEKRSAESLGGRTAAQPLPIGLILDTAYVPGTRWHPRFLSPGAALLTLLDNTVPARARPRQALEILHQAVSGAEGVRSRRGEADAVAEWMLKKAARNAQPECPTINGRFRGEAPTALRAEE